MRYLDHIRRCNAFDPARFLPFLVGGEQVGHVRRDFSRHLTAFPAVFAVTDQRVALQDTLATSAERTDAIRQTARRLFALGLVPKLRGEDFPLVTDWGQAALAVLDRTLVPFFGLRAFGIHVNGFVRQGDRLKLWVGRRAPDREVEPDKLDNLVAGGQPAGLSLAQNLVKEAAEEAAIPADLALRAIPVGAVSYCMDGERGLKPDTLFLYDLELPADFTPANNDGEIACFTLMDIDEVAEIVRTGYDFKFNVALVLIDFLIRHGRLSPDNEPDYLALVTGLRVPLS